MVVNNIINSSKNIYNINELENLNKNYINKNNNIKTVNNTPNLSTWNTDAVPPPGTTVDTKIEGLHENIKHAIAERFVNLSLVQAPKQLNATMSVAEPITGFTRKRGQGNISQNSLAPELPNQREGKRPKG